MKDLEGQCHEIFVIFLFHESKPSGPLINRLKWFCLKIRFRGNIREKFEYLRENEFFRKTVLACLSEDQMGLIHEKKRSKIS